MFMILRMVKEMKCEVHSVYKNIRYNLLDVDGEHYIIDKDRPFIIVLLPFLIFLFPFIHWLFPLTAFKINRGTVEKVKELKFKPQKDEFKKIIVPILITSVVAYPVIQLLSYLMDYFKADTSTIVKVIIFSALFLIVLLLRFYFSKFNQKSLSKHINMEKLEGPRKVWIRPSKLWYLFMIVPYYFMLGFAAVGGVFLYFAEGSIILLLFAIILCFCVMLLNCVTVIFGTTKVKFLGDKR